MPCPRVFTGCQKDPGRIFLPAIYLCWFGRGRDGGTGHVFNLTKLECSQNKNFALVLSCLHQDLTVENC